MTPCAAMGISAVSILVAVGLAAIAIAAADTIAQSVTEFIQRLRSNIRIPSLAITIPGILVPAAIALYLTISAHMSIDHQCTAQIIWPAATLSEN